jgi:hypothetical protein
MKTTLKAISLIVLFSAATATTASALVNYPQSWYSGACVNLSRDLSYNMRGSDVSQLQSFLVTQNFPGGGNWMVTGFFGGATESAVRDFQQGQGLPTTGIADVATRAAISQITCGGLVAYTAPSATAYPATIPWSGYSSNYPYNYPYTYPYNYGNYVSLNLTSLSQNTGTAGTQVTIYGTGFDATNNTINFGSVALSGVPSNGTSLTFVVPAYTISGNVNITVTDSRGTSNALVFTVYSYGYGCGSNYLYPYGTYNNYYGGSCGCANAYPYSYYGNYYGYCGTTIPTSNNITSPIAYYLNPVSGGTGTSVTVLGSGFTATGNAVHFGTGVIGNLISADGQSVSFTVPTQLVGYGSQNTGLGVYDVSVTNGDGYSTNALPFTVTSLGTNGSGVLITNVSGPTSIAAGTVGTWTVTLNNPGNSLVTVSANWGDSSTYPYNNRQIAPQTTSAQGVITLSFTHVYSANGTYTISFTASNGNGTPSTSTMTVVVGGSGAYSSGAPMISYLAPSAGYVGTQVTIYGSNLSGVNAILFGSGAIQNVYSQNGASLTFAVPSYVTPYCASGVACPQYAQEITPGTYDVSVMGVNGTSNTVPFTVQ